MIKSFRVVSTLFGLASQAVLVVVDTKFVELVVPSLVNLFAAL